MSVSQIRPQFRQKAGTMPNDKDTLLANARQSTKNEQVTRLERQAGTVRQWWEDEYSTIEEYARECIPDSYENDGKCSDCETALESVRKNLRRCKATSRETFLVWVTRQIAKQPGFYLTAGAIKRFDLDVSNWIDTATLRHERYTDFEYEKDGDLYRLNLGTDQEPIPWTIPEKYWQFAKNVWPVFAKRKTDGFYVAKKIGGVAVPLHRLVMNCEPGDTVQSTSGNLLDWTSLYVRPLNHSGIYEGRNTSWNKEASRPNTTQEEFESRFQPARKALKNYGTNFDNTERFVLHQPIPVNADLAARSMCWGTVASTGWVDPITPAEWNYYAPELPSIPVEKSARRLAVEQKLDRLGL